MSRKVEVTCHVSFDVTVELYMEHDLTSYEMELTAYDAVYAAGHIPACVTYDCHIVNIEDIVEH